MKYRLVETKDKMGRTVVIRNPEPEDAEELLKCIIATKGETPYLLGEPDEVHLDVKQEEEIIKERVASDKALLLVAVVDGEIAGSGSISPHGYVRRYYHRCDLSLSLYRKYWGQGIGGMMLDHLIDGAKQMGYGQIELVVIQDNKRAVEMYKNRGFVTYGEYPNSTRISEDVYLSSYWMMRKL